MLRGRAERLVERGTDIGGSAEHRRHLRGDLLRLIGGSVDIECAVGDKVVFSALRLVPHDRAVDEFCGLRAGDAQDGAGVLAALQLAVRLEHHVAAPDGLVRLVDLVAQRKGGIAGDERRDEHERHGRRGAFAPHGHGESRHGKEEVVKQHRQHRGEQAVEPADGYERDKLDGDHVDDNHAGVHADGLEGDAERGRKDQHDDVEDRVSQVALQRRGLRPGEQLGAGAFGRIVGMSVHGCSSRLG